MKAKHIILIGLFIIIILACLPKNNAKPRTINIAVNNNATNNNNTGSGGTDDNSSGGTGGDNNNNSGGGTGGTTPDNFTNVYQYGSNYVKYVATPNVFEKTTGYNRDAGRRMMPIDLFSWCIANRNRDKLIFCHYKLKDANGNVMFEVNDTEGAVHVALAQNERETQRGNNHQEQYGRFLIKEGTYTLEFTRLSNSAGVPSLWFVEQHDGNRFKCLIGNSVGQMLGSVDNIGLNITNTYTTTFTVDFIDVSNCFIKTNANGFDS